MKSILAFVFMTLFACAAYAQQPGIDAGEVIRLANQVAEWQLEYPGRYDIYANEDGRLVEVSVLFDGSPARKRDLGEFVKPQFLYPAGWEAYALGIEEDMQYCALPAEVKETAEEVYGLDPTSVLGVRILSRNAKGWEMGAFYAGMLSLMEIVDNPAFEDAMIRIATANSWELGDRVYHADDHCVGQLYLEMYDRHREPMMIADVQMTFDWVMENPHPQSLAYEEGKDRWSWCDALFMAPPVLAKLTDLTGDPKYLEYMDQEWWLTYDHLYDKEEHLFYRDDRYLTMREENGEKVFWSRGNGWVLAGLTKVIPLLPDDHPSKDKYIKLFTEIAKRVASLLPADGLFRSSLLDPESYPAPESSSTAFFLYAVTWGINHGYLDEADHQTFIKDAWESLTTCVNVEGKLGWIQLPGSEPGQIEEEWNAPYGTGAFLLAASELHNYLRQK